MTISATPARFGRLFPRALGAVGVPWYAYGLVQCGLAFAAERGGAGFDTPLVVWALFAIASGAGLTGAALLLGLRFGGAARAFGLSLASALSYYAWVYGASGTASLRPAEEAIIGAVVVAVTTGLFLYSRTRAGRG